MIEPDGVLDGDHGETVAVWFGVGHGQSDYPDPIKATQPVKLLNEGKLGSWKVGTNRRVKLEDLLVYRDQRDRERRQSLQELADLDQELGLL